MAESSQKRPGFDFNHEDLATATSGTLNTAKVLVARRSCDGATSARQIPANVRNKVVNRRRRVIDVPKRDGEADTGKSGRWTIAIDPPSSSDATNDDPQEPGRWLDPSLPPFSLCPQ